MVFDFFCLFNELDILWLRLCELENVVDKFVIVESNVTFKGDPKPLHYHENRHQFGRWHEKIIHIVVDDMPTAKSLSSHPNDPCWLRDIHQREAGFKKLEFADDDVIIYADCDEIPRPEVVKNFHPQDGIWAMEMDMYVYYLNIQKKERWVNPKIVSGRWARGKRHREISYWDGIRNNRVLPRAGWHFTYMGGPESIVDKVNALPDWAQPTSGPMLDDVRTGNILKRDAAMIRKVPINESFPASIRNNIPFLIRRNLLHVPLL